MLVDGGPVGDWAAQLLRGADGLVAPHLAIWETDNIIRRQEAAGRITTDQAVLAHADLLDLQIDLWPYEPLAARSWELRRNLTVYDASYVALAELTDSPLATLDERIGRAPGIRCSVTSPPGP